MCLFFYLATFFDFKAAEKNLKKISAQLIDIPYKSMEQQLYSKSVITQREKQQLDRMINTDQMSTLIDILIVSLKLSITEKYKGFLQTMEESEDQTLKVIAKRLGE